MDIKGLVEKIVPEIDSADKIYGLFKSLNYPEDKVLDPTYKRRIEEFDFAKEEREKLKDIYTVFNYDGKLQILLIEAKSLSVSSVKYITKHLSDRYLRFLLILTTDYKEYTFVFPEFERIEEGRHKLKLTRLNFDRTQPYHTDLLTISNISLKGDEEDWKDIWKRWKDAFSVEKVTDSFFEDYKNAFFEIRKTFEKQKIPVKNSHELSQQFLNRLMFLYFISKKRWLNDDSKFIKWYWDRYREEKRKGSAKENTFYEDYLRMLFLEAFNNKYSHPNYHPKDVEKILAAAPYLNGGLFRRNELDDLPFSISDSLFEKVFSFFEKYNFTIREELPLDVEVAVDPQMIGYVYESLSNVAEEIYERQDLGIFYTPTIEVDFMCRRSVVEYLNNHLAGTDSNSPLSRGVGGVFPSLKKGSKIISPPLAKGGKGGFGLLKEKFLTGKYEGNKWGGKYLRAPDIFFTILEKGKWKLIRLGDIAEVRRGFTTGCNDFFYLPSKFFDIKKDGKYYELIPKDKDQPKGIRIEEEYLPFAVLSPRDVDSLYIKSSDLNKHLLLLDHKSKLSQDLITYIKWGERQKFNQRPTCKSRDKWWSLSRRPECFLACNYLVNDYMRFYCSRKGAWFSDNFQEIHSSKSYVSLAVVLNSILSQFFINMIGRSNFGGGLLKIQTYEVSDLLCVDPSRIKHNDKYMEEILIKFSDKCNLSIYDQCGLNPDRPIREQKPNPLPDRKALDDIVFDILGLTEDERNEVYWAVCELVKNRLEKARSV